MVTEAGSLSSSAKETQIMMHIISERGAEENENKNFFVVVVNGTLCFIGRRRIFDKINQDT
jgi:hypothetical protein